MDGKVTLLGAGPGNPEYLTTLGLRRLKEADVVLYDRLVNPSLLMEVNPAAELVDVGKLPKFHKVRQTKINEMLVDYATAGKRIVRLKAGDPYVFGRGGEEAQVLRDQGVSFEVIPGITSAIAGLAAAGIPITHRDYASSFHIITGHHKADGTEMDWQNIAHQEGTLVFLMGMAELNGICQSLIQNGKNPQTPVAIIQWATQWRQKKVIGDLTNIVTLVEQQEISSPALIVVGEVVKLSPELEPQLPLSHAHLLVPYSETNRLFNCLQDLGATADFYPRSIPVAEQVELPDLAKYDTMVIDGRIAFQRLVELLTANDQDLRSLIGIKIVALNAPVARYLKQQGILVDAIGQPAKPGFLEVGGEQSKCDGGDFLKVYHRSNQAERFLPDPEEFDGIIFPSSDSIDDFVEALDEDQKCGINQLIAFTMGSTVSNNAQNHNFKQVIQCEPSIDQTILHIKETLANE